MLDVSVKIIIQYFLNSVVFRHPRTIKHTGLEDFNFVDGELKFFRSKQFFEVIL